MTIRQFLTLNFNNNFINPGTRKRSLPCCQFTIITSNKYHLINTSAINNTNQQFQISENDHSQ